MRTTHVMIAAASFALPFSAAGARPARPAPPTAPMQTPPATPVQQPAPVPDTQTVPEQGTTAPTMPTAPTVPPAPAPAPNPATPGTATTPSAATTNAATAAATQADLKAGTPVFDQTGGSVGTIESANAQGGVVATGKARARIPIASFGKNDRGLVIAMTKVQLEAAAAGKAAHP